MTGKGHVDSTAEDLHRGLDNRRHPAPREQLLKWYRIGGLRGGTTKAISP